MNEMIPRLEGTEMKTRGCDAQRSRAWESTLHRGQRVLPGTLVSDGPTRNVSGATRLGNRTQLQKSSRPSRWTANYGRRDRLIREEIIGHSMRAVRRMDGPRIDGLRRVLNTRRAFALLHKPSREHGGGVFFEPRVEQLSNLLAEIGGVTEPRQLVALQRGTRGRQEKLPRRLGFVDGHEYLQRETWERL